jgi:hypothetical protein
MESQIDLPRLSSWTSHSTQNERTDELLTGAHCGHSAPPFARVVPDGNTATIDLLCCIASASSDGSIAGVGAFRRREPVDVEERP